MGVAQGAWTILGTAFRCRGVPADAASDLEELLRAFPEPGSEGPAMELRVEAAGAGRFAVTGDPGGRRREVATAEAPLAAHLEYLLVNEAIQRAADRHVLHAGAVVAGGGTCLVVGESGAGKTSLTLWLWASGFPLLTDDLCPILRPSLAPEPFPRALHMDAEYSPRLLARIPARPAGYPLDYYPFPGDASAAPPPVRHLLVLERGPRPAGEVERLGRSETAHHLLRAVIRNPDFQFDAALEDILRIAGACAAFRIRSSTPEGAATRALEALSA